MLGGVVVYSNEAKTALAGVDPELIARLGAVSAEVADALADGALARFGADVGIGITGIAGPGGGTPEKPVGRVHVSVADRAGARIARKLDLPGSRADVRDRTTTVALHLLRRLLLRRSSATTLGGRASVPQTRLRIVAIACVVAPQVGAYHRRSGANGRSIRFRPTAGVPSRPHVTSEGAHR